MPMEATQSVKVQYDVTTQRVDVTVDDKRVSIPGTYKTIDEARKAAEAYAKRWLTEK
jgi:rRNA processing protein Krr1/Pno1